MIAKYLVHELHVQACASMQQCEPHFPRLVPRHVHFLCVSTNVALSCLCGVILVSALILVVKYIRGVSKMVTSVHASIS